MRVISGKFRGRALVAPPGDRTRPMTDRVKETLFNILGSRHGTPGTLPDVAVLDIFAGSGGLGIEALSRGARSCLFIERDRAAIRAIKENLKIPGLSELGTLSTENAWTMRYPPAPTDNGTYGLVFVDPPYRDVADTLRVLDLLDRLAQRITPTTGVIVFRHSAGISFPEQQLQALTCDDDRTFGRMRVLLLVRAEEPRV